MALTIDARREAQSLRQICTNYTQNTIVPQSVSHTFRINIQMRCVHFVYLQRVRLYKFTFVIEAPRVPYVQSVPLVCISIIVKWYSRWNILPSLRSHAPLIHLPCSRLTRFRDDRGMHWGELSLFSSLLFFFLLFSHLTVPMKIYLFRIRSIFSSSIVCIRLLRAYAQFDDAIVWKRASDKAFVINFRLHVRRL